MLITERKFIVYDEILQKCHKNQNDKLQLRNINYLNIGDIIKVYSLLSNNRDFDKSILDLIKEKSLNLISWHDYLENMLNIFAENQPKLTEISTIDSYTPIWLIDLILDKYTSEDFSNPNLKWFNPVNKNGYFLLRLTQRLLNGLKTIPGLEDENERYKWIVENMIFACETNTLNMFNYMMYLDPFCQFNINIYCGLFKDKKFIHLNKNWYFDNQTRILGNPGPEWQSLLNKSFQISHYVNFILPICIMRSNSKTLQSLRKKIQDKENWFDLIQTIDCNVFINNKVIFTTKESENPSSNVILKDKILKINNSEIIRRIPESESKIFSILDKIEEKAKNNKLDFISDFGNNSRDLTSEKLIKSGVFSLKKDDTYKYTVHYSSSKIFYSKDKMKTWGKLKVAFTYSGKLVGKNRYGQPYTFVTTNLIGKQMTGIEVKTQEEADIILNNYSLKLFEFYNLNERSSGFNQGTLNNLPKLPLRKFSDSELYNWFSLTVEEIDLIETTIKR